MSGSWYALNLSQVVGTVVTAVGLYVALGIFIRLNGLRSLTKMSSFDFVSTVAFGSLIAATVLSDRPSLGQGVVALAALFLLQGGWSVVRRHIDLTIVENQPILLMDGPEILHDNLRHARVTQDDLYAKLRESNVLNLDEVRAVVLESTGDVSVLHGRDADFDRGLLAGVATP